MTDTPKVSVIMSVYNDEKYILLALRSILKQTIKDMEIIIIDDCSIDATVAKIELLHDARIKLLKNQENQGLTRNLNHALRLSRGKFIARMDGDDISLPKRFATQIKYLEEHPEVMLVSCQTKSFGSQSLVSRVERNADKLRAAMLVRPVLAHPGFMMRSELVQRENFYYDENFSTAQDYDFASRVARRFPIGITGPVLLLYRKHGGQVSERQTGEQAANADRVRQALLKEAGVSFSETELEDYRLFAREEQVSNREVFDRVKGLIKRILQANNETLVYDQGVLLKTLLQLYFTWVIRNKSLKIFIYVMRKCDNMKECLLLWQVLGYIIGAKVKELSYAGNIMSPDDDILWELSKQKTEMLSFKRRIYRKICYKLGRFIPDKMYIKMLYQVRLGRKCDLRRPKSFNEKINWLKLYDRQAIYVKTADKYAVRDYVAEHLGEKYLIPLLGVWGRAEDIDFDTLPEQFVLKCTHDSGSVLICTDKKSFNQEEARRNLREKLAINHARASREWVYDKITPVIIAEKYMIDESGTELKDYKFYCFNGEVKLIHVDFSRFTDHHRNLYSPNWDFINEMVEYPVDESRIIERPICLDEMLKCAQKLSVGMPFVRIDFYVVNDKIYFGEVTFYPDGGFTYFKSDNFERQLGDYIVCR